MNFHLTKTRLLTAVSALTITVGSLVTIVTPASADTITHHINRLTQMPPPGAASPRVQISSFEVSNYNSDQCLGISANRNNQPAVQWDCNGHADQQWHWGSQNSTHPGWYQLVNNNGSCLGVARGSTVQGARVVGWSCLGSSHLDQYWLPLNFGCGGYVPLGNLNSGYVLGVSANSTDQGAPVVQWTYQGVCNNQFWSGI